MDALIQRGKDCSVNFVRYCYARTAIVMAVLHRLSQVFIWLSRMLQLSLAN